MTLLLGCNGQTTSKNESYSGQVSLIQKEPATVKRNPEDYVKNYNGENNKLFVFV